MHDWIWRIRFLIGQGSDWTGEGKWDLSMFKP
jgi:hypothetical protein